MFQALFKIIFNLLATIIQVVLLPINTLINNALPDLTYYINWFTENLSTLFVNFSWFINILPPISRSILIFGIDILVVKYTIYMSTHLVIKIWNLFQKIKFW